MQFHPMLSVCLSTITPEDLLEVVVQNVCIAMELTCCLVIGNEFNYFK